MTNPTPSAEPNGRKLTGDTATDLKMVYSYEAGLEDGRAEVRARLDAVQVQLDRPVPKLPGYWPALVGVGESPRHESDPADVLDDDADYQKAYCWEMHASPDTPLYDYEPAASCCGHAASYHALLAGAQALRATVAPSSPEEPTP